MDRRGKGIFVDDGIRWLADLNGERYSVVFARGVGPEELVVRMGGDLAAASMQITHADVRDLGLVEYRPNADGDAVVRVGGQAGWSFALEYGDSTGGTRLEEISRDGVEVVRYVSLPDHPPATVDYACDGQWVCGLGLGEEATRWGRDRDLLVPELIAAQVLLSDGSAGAVGQDQDPRAGHRRTLGVFERRFGLSLSPSFLDQGRLPVHAVSGSPRISIAPDPDVATVRAWAMAHGHLPAGAADGRIPAYLRDAYEQAHRI